MVCNTAFENGGFLIIADDNLLRNFELTCELEQQLFHNPGKVCNLHKGVHNTAKYELSLKSMARH